MLAQRITKKKSTLKVSRVNHPTFQLNNYLLIAPNDTKLVPSEILLHELSNGTKNTENGVWEGLQPKANHAIVSKFGKIRAYFQFD